MKTSPVRLNVIAALAACLLTAQLAAANTWSGGAGADQRWSTANNWFEFFAPDGQAVLFYDAGAAGAAGTVNNVVDRAFTVTSLQVANTNGFHTMRIDPGQTLTVSGGLTVGTELDSGTSLVINTAITGPGATLNISGGNLTVRQGSVTSGGTQRATLDLSGLDTLTATVGSVSVGRQNITRATGTLYLANTNLITATTEIDLAYNNSNPGGANYLYLGQTNAIFANAVQTGRRKTTGNLLFRPGLTSPKVLFRHSDGTSAVGSWNIGDNSSETGTTSSGTTGTADFTGGVVDALVNNMIIGRSKNGTPTSGNANGVGTLTFEAGTFEVNTLELGYQGGANISSGIGTVNVNGTGTLVVNTSFRLGFTSGGTGAATTRGVLNINGGTARVPTITAGAGGANNTVSVSNNGALIVTNTAGPGINTLTLADSRLTLPAYNGASSFMATNLTTGGTTNILNISSVPTVAAYPAQFTLIEYSGAIAGSGFNFGLGTLPASTPPLVGHLANNAGAVVLVITSGPMPARTLLWSGSVNGLWDTSTANWTFGGATAYNQNDFVRFDNTAPGTANITLTPELTPSSITVSNTTAKNYAFSGNGNIRGTTGLTKAGAGSLTLNNDLPNDFSGPIHIEAGTLQVGTGGTGGSLGTGPIVNDGALVFNRLDDVTVANVISGGGSIAHNGASTLILGGANTFTGAVNVTQGVLRPNNNSALGTADSGTFLANNTTLDVQAATANSRNLGAEVITVQGAGYAGYGAIVNNGTTAQQNAVRNVVLAGNTVFNAPTRWDIRNSGGTASLGTGGSAYNLTKIGAEQFSLVGVTVDPALANIDVQQGTFSVETSTSSLGNPASTLSIQSGARLQLHNLNLPLDKQISLAGDGLNGSLRNNSGANTIIGPMTLNGACVLDIVGTSLTLSNTITGTGGLTKDGTNTLILNGNASHAGGTFVNVGTLVLNGTHAGGLTNYPSTSLAGAGTNNATVDVGGDLYPGALNGPGTLKVNGLLNLRGGTLFYDLGPARDVGNGVNDLLEVDGNVNLSFNQVLIRLAGGSLSAGSYRLINYTGTRSGELGYAWTGGSSRFGFTLDHSTPHQVNLIVSGSAGRLKWNSTSSPVWDVGFSYNWLSLIGNTNDIFYDGDSVLLDDTGGVVTGITLDAIVSPSFLTNNSSVNNFSITGAGVISGGASIIKTGTSTLTLNTSNDFTGTVLVGNGTLAIGNNGALGATSGATYVTNTGRIDIGTTNFAADAVNITEPIFISGGGFNNNGTLVNNSTNQQINAIRNLTLAGNATIGGTGRWDLRGTGNALHTLDSAFTLTKKGTNQVALVACTVDSNFGGVDIQEGIFGIQTTTVQNSGGFGDPTKSITVRTNATLNIWALGLNYPMDKVIVLDNGATVWNDSGDSILTGPVTLNGPATFNMDGGTTLTFSNALAGSGGVVKTGSGTLILSGANTYAGSTLVNAGTLTLGGNGSVAGPILSVASGATLNASARTDATLTLASGQSLQGNGTLQGSLAVLPGASVAPGTSVGKLTVSGSAGLSGTILIEIDKNAGTNDVLQAGSSITYNGTLNVSFLTGAPAPNDSYKMFYAGSYSGVFTSIVPATPGSGLAWDTTGLTNGTLKVIATLNPIPTNITVVVSGGQIDLSWPPDRTGWILEGQTNAPGLGIGTAWFPVPGSTATNRIIIIPDPTKGSVLYRLRYP